MKLRNLGTLPALGLALALAACGGGSSSHAPTVSAPAPGAATGLTYTDPTATGWRLLKDASSTDTRLVLNLVGPSGLLTRGVGFNLQGPTGVKFGAFANRLAINDLGVFELLSVSGNLASEPVCLIGGVKKGNLLTVGIYQKSRGHSSKDAGQPLCQIVLGLDAAAGLHAGDPLTLTVTKSGSIPDDIGTYYSSQGELYQKCRVVPLNITIGSLSAK